jgi:predicted nucleic acid-binding protein
VITVVVDASVGVKWLAIFEKEEFADRAKTVLNRRTAGELLLLVPDLFWLEVSNALCKATRRNKCSSTEADQALEEMQELPLQTLSSTELVNSAQEIAIRYGRSIYDSVYIAMAKETRSELVTADERLANAIARHLPVRWLGAI